MVNSLDWLIITSHSVLISCAAKSRRYHIKESLVSLSLSTPAYTIITVPVLQRLSKKVDFGKQFIPFKLSIPLLTPPASSCSALTSSAYGALGTGLRADKLSVENAPAEDIIDNPVVARDSLELRVRTDLFVCSNRNQTL